jgi:hypothetical protein
VNIIKSWLHHIRDNKKVLLFAAAGVVILILHIGTLLRYPKLHVDEVWLISRAWAFIQSGHQFGQLDSGPVQQFDGYWIVNQWFITALQSLALRFSPAPALLPVRILALLLGLCLLGINYWMVFHLGGHRLAAISTLLLESSWAFFYTAHMARYDILAAVLGYAALAMLIVDDRDRFIMGALSGFLAGMAIETHLNCLIFIPALGVIFLVESGWHFFTRRSFWGLCTGLLAGGIYYLSLRVLPNPDTYSKINAILVGQPYVPPLLSFNLDVILNGLLYGGLLLVTGVLALVVPGICAIPGLVHKPTKAKLKILWVNVCLFLGLALIIPNKSPQYSILLTPAFLWLAALFLQEHFQQAWQATIKNYAGRAIILGALFGSFVFNVLQLVPDNYQNYLKAQQQVNLSIKPGDVVIGNQWFWLGLPDHRYYSWELLPVYPRFYPDATLSDIFEAYKPDIFIVDTSLTELIRDDIVPNTFWYYQHIPRKAFYEYLDKHARLINTISSDLYGEIWIYRFTWE